MARTATALVCALLVSTPLAAQHADSLALVALYGATSGQSWTVSTGWLTGPLESWHGVTLCNGRVSSLDLSGNGLRRARDSNDTGDGMLPPEIGDLDSLQTLDLSDNELRGGLPSGFSDLGRLRTIMLQYNLLTALADLSVLTGLDSVDVRANLLTFEDLEPNVGHHFAIDYTPQHPVDADRNVRGYLGDRVVLHVPVGGAANQYQWYKGGLAVPLADRDSLVISPMTRDDAGTYELHVTNTVVPGLVLKSVPIKLRYEQRFAALWLDIGAYHHLYVASGARHENSPHAAGMQYPAILRYSGHLYAKAWWVGARNWSDTSGVVHPYRVTRVGPRTHGSDAAFPVLHRSIC